MSGTSLDGIDAAIVETDDETITALGPWLTTPYDTGLRERLRGCMASLSSTSARMAAASLVVAAPRASRATCSAASS